MSFPIYPEEITPTFVSWAISRLHPGTAVSAAQWHSAEGFGSRNVSTAARVRLRLNFDTNPHSLPSDALVKMPKTNDWPQQQIALNEGIRQRPPRVALFQNEVNFYRHIGPVFAGNVPLPLAAEFDEHTDRFFLLLDDLETKDTIFPTQDFDAPLNHVEALLSVLALYHSTFWESRDFEGPLAWVQSQGSGSVASTLRGPVRQSVEDEIVQFKFKRELLCCAGIGVEELFAGMDALQRHQATLPTTLLHGDTHFGNSFLTADGDPGFFDWQLVARGFCIHDVAYLIITSLSIEQRRKHESTLLQHYREALLAANLKNVPSIELFWLEYRRAAHWCVTIGWLPCPPEAYGWELAVMGNLRTFTAYNDLETKKALAPLL